MIQNELRIGNIIYHRGTETIWSLSDFERLNDGTYTVRDICPVPLTEEWIIKLGFKKIIGYYIEIDDNKNLELAINNDSCEIQYYVYFRNKDSDDYCLLRKDLKYVHQLQNLYHALTGEELTC